MAGNRGAQFAQELPDCPSKSPNLASIKPSFVSGRLYPLWPSMLLVKQVKVVLLNAQLSCSSHPSLLPSNHIHHPSPVLIRESSMGNKGQEYFQMEFSEKLVWSHQTCQLRCMQLPSLS